MPTAVHFGAGLIGRGYLGERFAESNYEVVFCDVVDDLIANLQKTPEYTVTEVSEEGERQIKISNYRAINSKHHEDQAVAEIAKADAVTCAVGVKILKFIAPVIAKGIEAREKDYPLAVIACENAIMATDQLAEFIKEKLSDDTKKNLDSKARFANSAIDRIVPAQPADAGLNVRIEKFYEWCVELPPFKGMQEPKVDGIHYVDDLGPFIERKIFTVNTGHAVTAYYGYNKGKEFIYESLQDEDIRSKVRGALKETASLIVKKYGIPQKEQDEYVEMIIKRFTNPALPDRVVRVGREPLRKLSRKDRLISPAAQLTEMGMPCDNLIAAVEMALRFQNVPDDEDSAKLAQILKEKSAEEATIELTGLDKSHALFPKILAIVEKVQKS